jgi:hypothetical protein
LPLSPHVAALYDTQFLSFDATSIKIQFQMSRLFHLRIVLFKTWQWHWGLVWFDKTAQACQGPTSFVAYERGLVIFEYSHVFRSGGSLMHETLPYSHHF